MDIGEDWDGQAVPLLNATTFGAMYLDRGKQSADMPFHAFNSIAEGVEVPYRTPEDHRDGAMYIPSAATWILLAGKRIYELCESNHNRESNLYREGDSRDFVVNEADCKWHNDRGYSLDRRAFWKRRFCEIKMLQGFQDDVRDLAGRAFIKMSEVESQMK